MLGPLVLFQSLLAAAEPRYGAPDFCSDLGFPEDAFLGPDEASPDPPALGPREGLLEAVFLDTGFS
ncbi:hypothetical protein D3C87_1642620 [compost metagenome]